VAARAQVTERAVLGWSHSGWKWLLFYLCILLAGDGARAFAHARQS
jgi:hypothetical protein